MFYDLNIAWSPSTTPDQLLQILTFASSLGYGTVALNHSIPLPLPANPTSPFPKLPSSTSPSSPKIPNVLHRATIAFSDPQASNYRIPSLASVYDILAIRPLTEKAFQNACLTLDIPIISLDLTQHFPFHFRPKPCMAAVSRGVRFEICYGQVLAASDAGTSSTSAPVPPDPRARANFISNATELIRATRGRGIILSSEARTPLALRAPADVINLLSVWGLGSERGMQALGEVPRGVVVNEGLKRNGFRGVVEIKQVAKKPVVEGDGGAAGDSKKQKRKPDAEDGQISKRQAKKQRLAQQGNK